MWATRLKVLCLLLAGRLSGWSVKTGTAPLNPKGDSVRLQATYQLEGMSPPYEHPPTWQNASLQPGDNNTALLSVWKDDVEDFDAATEELDSIVKSCYLGLKFNGYPRLFLGDRLRLEKIPLDQGSLPMEPQVLGGGMICGGSAVISSIKLPPDKMPSIPLECERWVLTWSEVQGLPQKHVDEQLKREYLILEELWADYTPSRKDDKLFEDIKLIRNFVSHPICDRTNVVKLVSQELSSASMTYRGKPAVRYERQNIDHRNYVCRYEALAHAFARQLIEKEISKFA